MGISGPLDSYTYFLRPLTTEDIYANGGVSPNFTLKKDQDIDAR